MFLIMDAGILVRVGDLTVSRGRDDVRMEALEKGESWRFNDDTWLALMTEKDTLSEGM